MIETGNLFSYFGSERARVYICVLLSADINFNNNYKFQLTQVTLNKKGVVLVSCVLFPIIR